MTNTTRSRLTPRPRPSGLGGASLAAGVGVGISVLALLAPTAAVADDGARPVAPASVSSADRDAAAKALASQDTTDRVGSFFVRLAERERATERDTLDAGVTRAEAAAQAPRLVGPAVPVYSLNPDFVRGRSTAAEPVAEFAYLASEVRSASGATATVWTVRDAKTQRWAVANVISGTDEVSFGRKSAGDLVFTEPQIAAWYALDGDRVLPLNKSARDAVGARGTSVAAYQDRVHDRYADKLPGSDYQRSGQFGGDGPADAQAAPPADAPRATASDGSSSAGLSGAGLAAAGVAGGALLIGAGTVTVRLRRRTTAG
ncbi:hypothetical protein AB0F42_00420 [Streptomyces buecherae]|uniref:hypothetical protein n=1 Tax=Streptomyces buecherae TaxID=2763006 RepID=UPI0033CDD651